MLPANVPSESSAFPSNVPLAYSTANRLKSGAGVGFGNATAVGNDAATADGTTIVGGGSNAAVGAGITAAVGAASTPVAPIKIIPGALVTAVNVGERRQGE